MRSALFTLPNLLSSLRIILSPIFAAMFVAPDPTVRQLSLLVFFIAAITDWYDGEIARKHGPITNLGKFLDPLADKVLTSFAFIAFASIGLVAWWMITVIIVRDIVITTLRSIAEVQHQPIVTTKSAQTKTFVQMTVLYYLLLLYVLKDVAWIREPAADVVTALLDPIVVYILMFIVTAITVYTGAEYLVHNRKMIHEIFKTGHNS